MKKILIIFLVLVLAVSGTITYLNLKVLPTRIRALIIEVLEESTQKKAILGSVSFNVFKGLVLRDLIIYDGNIAIFNSKEISCVFLIPPVFKKDIIIPYISIRSPEIYAHRRPDGELNLLDLFKNTPPVRKHDFRLLVYKVAVADARVSFHDDTLNPPFTKEINALNAEFHLSFPKKVKFDVKAMIHSEHPAALDLFGEYDLSRRELKAYAGIKDIAPKEFETYFVNDVFLIPQGRMDAGISINYKDSVIGADLDTKSAELIFSKDGFSARLDSSAKAGLRYSLADKTLKYRGSMNINRLDLSGVDGVGSITGIKGELWFSDSALSSDNISASVFGLPVKAKIRIADLENPAMDIDASSELRLAVLQEILRDSFAIHIPAEIHGQGRLHMVMRYRIPDSVINNLSGSLDVSDATVNTVEGRMLLKNVFGAFRFTPNQLTWSDIAFRRLDKDFKSSGTLTNFRSPGIHLELRSRDLALDSVMALTGRSVTFSKFALSYQHSELSMSGSFEFAGRQEIASDIKGVIDADFRDLAEAPKKFRDKIEKVKPSGKIRAQFTLKGNALDPRSCAIDAKLMSDKLSVYDFKLSDFSMAYIQNNGVADIMSISSNLYDGRISGRGRVDMMSADTPYSFSAELQDINIEKLKTDTAFKDKNIAGTVRADIRLGGMWNDSGRLEGSGKLNITNGKLWELNFFRGLGVLLFSSDFSHIIFSEGECSFLIKDKSIVTDDLKLTSDLVDMDGYVKIGPDNSIDACLKIRLREGEVESGQTVRNVTRAISKYSAIEISGTLKDPKYKIKADVADIIDDLKKIFF